jgi:hypothetical protein
VRDEQHTRMRLEAQEDDRIGLELAKSIDEAGHAAAGEGGSFDRRDAVEKAP